VEAGVQIASSKSMGAVQREKDVAAVVRELVIELHPQRARGISISPSSRIEKDLGIDSLGRAELILRIERAFRVKLPIGLVGNAETVGDLLGALEQTGARLGQEPARMRPVAALPVVPAASEAQTLVEVLEWHVARHPDRLHLTVLQDDTTSLGALTYAQMAASARAVATGLIGRDIVPGDRIALMLPTSHDFFAAFFGILYAGGIPVPIYPPMRLSQIEDHLRRQAGILRNAGARLLITVPEGQRLVALLQGQVEVLGAVETVASLSAQTGFVRLPPLGDSGSTALIQYTSGSTGDPKGVVLSHANLLANIRAMGIVMKASSADVFMSWLPLYHDMGLIGAWLGCLHFAAPLYVMSPLSFLVRPENWLWAMHRFRATLSASPNFGFELCFNKIEDADLEGLDLSALRMIANGAEPVSAPTLRRFTEKFERYGFRPEAMAPVYGLAENSVGLAFPPSGRKPIIDRVDRTALSVRGKAEPACSDDTRPLEIVACGQPLPGHEIRIIDADGWEVGERQEGRLEFRGPSATSGYFHNEVKTRALFHDGWLDSGDRAYLAGGDVFVTGRVKDIIIRAGRHIYPQQIEEAVAAIPGVRKGGVAVFGVTDRLSGTERVVLLAETREADAAARAALRVRAQSVVTDIAGMPPDEIVLAPPRSVPKTSSGKIRRSAAKELYERERIGAPPRALWRQIARMSLATVRPKLNRLIRRFLNLLYAGWWWTVIVCGFMLAWLAVMILPRREWRWTIVRKLARAALAAVGISLAVTGIERIPTRNAMLLFNHSSYMDAVVLAAALPGEPAFVAKKELATQFLAGPFLRRLGILFVDRFDVASSLSDAEKLATIAREGRPLAFFPEGTFTRRPGLSGFYLGAFKIAAEINVPVLPSIIRGTRTMLRADQWYPRRTSIEIDIGAPMTAAGNNFAAAIQLRDAARKAMLARCGEPDIDELMKPALHETKA
jgi:1-acyl-sn-glycerol-3-phosphate acyltransferase